MSCLLPPAVALGASGCRRRKLVCSCQWDPHSRVWTSAACPSHLRSSVLRWVRFSLASAFAVMPHLHQMHVHYNEADAGLPLPWWSIQLRISMKCIKVFSSASFTQVQAESKTATPPVPHRLARIAGLSVAVLLGCAAVWCVAHASSCGAMGGQSFIMSTAARAPVRFLSVGDWGRNGTYNQSLIAKQVGVCHLPRKQHQESVLAGSVVCTVGIFEAPRSCLLEQDTFHSLLVAIQTCPRGLAISRNMRH